MISNFQERIIAILRGSPNGLTSNEITELLGPTAKNMSSLDSHTMVPTLTMFGRFSECTRDVMAVPDVPTALVTGASMTLCSC